MKKIFLVAVMLMGLAGNCFAQNVENTETVVEAQHAVPLHIYLYEVKDYAALQDAQTKLEELTQNPVVVTRSNEELVELQSLWNGNENFPEQAKQALSKQFRMDTSYQDDQAMTLLFRYREQ